MGEDETRRLGNFEQRGRKQQSAGTGLEGMFGSVRMVLVHGRHVARYRHHGHQTDLDKIRLDSWISSCDQVVLYFKYVYSFDDYKPSLEFQ